MDVRCSACSTEFELDEARIPEEGLAVQCSKCNALFRVHRSGNTDQGAWHVRQANGNLFEFRELTTLQRWIVERKVGREDEISRGGKNWKRLGDIAELATFFQVVNQADKPATGPAPIASSTPAAYPAAQPTLPPHTGPAWEQTPQPTSQSEISGVWTLNTPGAPQPVQPMPAMAPVVVVQTTPAAPVSATPAPATPPAASPPPPPAEDFSSFDGDVEEADDDDLDFNTRGSSGKWIALVVLLILGAGGAYVYTQRPELIAQLMGPEIPELALNHVATGYTELYKDSNAGITAAIDNFEKAIALSAEYADAKAGLAEAQIALAEYRAEAAADLKPQLEAASNEDKAIAMKIDDLQQQASSLAEKAFTAAKLALELDKDGLKPNRAMADYYRYKRANDQMEPLLDRAKLVDPNDAAVAYITGSSMVGDPTTAERALRYFDSALEAAPDMHRARYKMARIYTTLDDKDKAIMHLEMILTEVADHDRAKALLLKLKPPDPEVAKPQPKSFDKLLAQADRLRDRDNAERALTLYEQALEMEPGDPDALTGIAYCYYDMSRNDIAIRTFQQVLADVPRFSDAHLGIAEAYKEKNMKRDAIKHYRQYLDILPNGPEAAWVRRALEGLE